MLKLAQSCAALQHILNSYDRVVIVQGMITLAHPMEHMVVTDGIEPRELRQLPMALPEARGAT